MVSGRTFLVDISIFYNSSALPWQSTELMFGISLRDQITRERGMCVNNLEITHKSDMAAAHTAGFYVNAR